MNSMTVMNRWRLEGKNDDLKENMTTGRNSTWRLKEKDDDLKEKMKMLV